MLTAEHERHRALAHAANFTAGHVVYAPHTLFVLILAFILYNGCCCAAICWAPPLLPYPECQDSEEQTVSRHDNRAGTVAHEGSQFGECNGRIMNPSMSEYHVPAHLGLPVIEVIWTNLPHPCTPAGACGIGEIGIDAKASAIVNAGITRAEFVSGHRRLCWAKR